MIYLISVFIGGLIGYVTNFIAIKMLFRPYKAKKIGNITIVPQGVVPKEKENLAKNVGSIAKEYLLDKEEIHSLINSEEFKQEIKRVICTKIDNFKIPDVFEFVKANPQKVANSISDFVIEMIKNKFPFAMAILNERMVANMVLENMDLFLAKLKDIVSVEGVLDKNNIKEKIQEDVVVFLEKESYGLIEKIEVDKIVQKKICNFDEKQLEDMLFGIMDKHFRFINLAGATLGGLIGLIQAFILTNFKF